MKLKWIEKRQTYESSTGSVVIDPVKKQIIYNGQVVLTKFCGEYFKSCAYIRYNIKNDILNQLRDVELWLEPALYNTSSLYYTDVKPSKKLYTLYKEKIQQTPNHYLNSSDLRMYELLKKKYSHSHLPQWLK